MSQICLAGIPRQPFTECDHCIDSYVDYSETTYPTINGGIWACTLTRRYRWHTCHLGLAVGRHVQSITLLPGEEVELEVVRRERFAAALHEQTSIEQEFEFEIQELLQASSLPVFFGSAMARFETIWAGERQQKILRRMVGQSVPPIGASLSLLSSRVPLGVPTVFSSLIGTRASTQARGI